MQLRANKVNEDGLLDFENEDGLLDSEEKSEYRDPEVEIWAEVRRFGEKGYRITIRKNRHGEKESSEVNFGVASSDNRYALSNTPEKKVLESVRARAKELIELNYTAAAHQRKGSFEVRL